MKYPTFAHWVQQARRRAPSSLVGGKVQFAQVQLPTAAPMPGTANLEVRLADGVVVRGDDVQMLAALVRALRS